MAQDSHPIGDNPKKTILLAEDDRTVRDVLGAILERAGFSLLVAGDGREAYRIASEHPDGIDLLVADVQMPGMAGPDLASVLKCFRPSLRVLMMSAYPEDMLMRDTGWGFLQKPFLPSVTVILDKIQHILNSPLPLDSDTG